MTGGEEKQSGDLIIDGFEELESNPDVFVYLCQKTTKISYTRLKFSEVRKQFYDQWKVKNSSLYLGVCYHQLLNASWETKPSWHILKPYPANKKTAKAPNASAGLLLFGIRLGMNRSQTKYNMIYFVFQAQKTKFQNECQKLPDHFN